jgi:hypothetical protein
MLHLNKTIIPNPDYPAMLDAYGGEAGPELVVVAVDQQKLHPAQRMLDLEAIARSDTSGEERVVLTCAFRGTMVDVLRDRFAAVLASAGLRPLGRMERRDPGAKPRPEDFDLAVAVNDLGARLRALREQTGLRMFELAHALRCSTVQLSRIELGEWVPGSTTEQEVGGGDERGANSAILASKIADHLLACKFIEAGTGQDVERSLIFLLGAASE